jgi:F-type H+-transporting ATPase subunit delta
MDKTKTNAIITGFWQYLKKEGKLNLLPEILRGLKEKSDETNDKAVVFSSSLLSENQKEEVGKIISSNFGVSQTEFEVDPKLIGGIKIKIGSEVLDLSTQNKLDYLTKSL